ncbi:MAG: penicillin-binding protein 1C [Rhodobiaceae bacterium]|nr:penicillin-binding protein 1C [Rhodobiaceae bacterium]MCC0049153.1 penicillin-binding protein 1C [Rhodobiaceae bacterium]
MVRTRKTTAIAAAGLMTLAAVPAGVSGYYAFRSVPDPVVAAPVTSSLVLDRRGTLLSPFLTQSGHWRLPVTAADVDPDYIRLLLAYEDKRFRAHKGIDWRAGIRAAWQMATHGRIVSGASTLTMQVVRLTGEENSRSLSGKFRQAVQAMRLEKRLSKDEILQRYLLRAPFGGNIEGVRAASLAWFGKEPRHLTLAESALLVALPQSPEARRPDRDPEAALAARNRVLDRALEAGTFSAAEIEYAKSQAVPDRRRPMPNHAPLTSLAAIADQPQGSGIRLTLDANLQTRLEELALSAARGWGGKTTAAIVAVDNATGDVIARIANAAYGSTERRGAVDMASAIRSPGSTLKPFVYAMAFEAGHARPATLIDDKPTRFGAWTPENFSDTWRGTVSVREALQHSLNVPAVLMMERVGPARFAARLNDTGHPLQLPEGTRPGLPVILGGAGTTLEDLASLYAGLARGGDVPVLKLRFGEAGASGEKPVTTRAVSWMIANILREAPAPDHAASGRISFKTGTSYGYRDAWAIGFDKRTTIAVWIGRADGAPVPGLIGREAAAPILFDAFARLDRPLEPVAAGEKEQTPDELPLPMRHFVRLGEEETLFSETAPPQIAYPPDGARIEKADGTMNGGGITVPIRIAGGVPPFVVMADNRPLQRGSRRNLSWQTGSEGFSTIVVIDSLGRRAGARVRIDVGAINRHVTLRPSEKTAQ